MKRLNDDAPRLARAMKKSKFTESQLLFALNGAPVVLQRRLEFETWTASSTDMLRGMPNPACSVDGTERMQA